MLLDENALVEIPAGPEDDMAAMTEPLAVGLDAPRSADPGDTTLMVGCSTIGLGVVRIEAHGYRLIIAADFHAHAW